MSSIIVYYTKKAAMSILYAVWHGFWVATTLTLIVKIVGISNLLNFFGIAMYYSLTP